MFVALIQERCRQDELGEEMLVDQFKAHMNRGVLLLNKRIRSLNDLKLVLPMEYRQPTFTQKELIHAE